VSEKDETASGTCGYCKKPFIAGQTTRCPWCKTEICKGCWCPNGCAKKHVRPGSIFETLLKK
jgi:hypothetical protein